MRRLTRVLVEHLKSVVYLLKVSYFELKGTHWAGLRQAWQGPMDPCEFIRMSYMSTMSYSFFWR